MQRKLNLPARLLFYLVRFPVLAGLWFGFFAFIAIIGPVGSSPWYADVLICLVIASSIFMPHLAFILQPIAAIPAAFALRHYTSVLPLFIAIFCLWAVAYIVSLVIIHRIRTGRYVTAATGFTIYKNY